MSPEKDAVDALTRSASAQLILLKAEYELEQLRLKFQAANRGYEAEISKLKRITPPKPLWAKIRHYIPFLY